MGKGENPCPLPLLALNHVSFVCKSVQSSTQFYINVLGFKLVKRPSSFEFQGAWLFNYGVGIHLLECTSVDDLPKKSEINPRHNHISFQSSDIETIQRKLEDIKMKYEKRVVEEGGVYIEQIFFHDPDGYMIEICNCNKLPLIPLTDGKAPTSVTRSRFPWLRSTPKKERRDSFTEISLVSINSDAGEPELSDFGKGVGSVATGAERCCSSVVAQNDQNPIMLDIMNFYL
ncbi:hypothetical protein SUGI_0488980 [Cryptomeria japonica]|uniref:glyoxylase I 4 n=1 Tax=Cryptomeria japonica TaxID=3369 RepID=UPI002408A70E|nr:glyoxylase I 4 [Cryptomeria japonica]GLJ25532.1 hypothetical protein SUGI_0488980 [Cryptomeria japonica]